MSTTLDHIRELVKQNKLKEALANLEELANENAQLNEVIINTARYNEISKLLRQGILKYACPPA